MKEIYIPTGRLSKLWLSKKYIVTNSDKKSIKKLVLLAFKIILIIYSIFNLFNQYSFSKEIDKRNNEDISDKCRNCLSKQCKEIQSKTDFDNLPKSYEFLSKKDEKEFLAYKNKDNLDFKIESKAENIYDLYVLEKNKYPKKFVLKCKNASSCNKECDN